MGLHDRGLQPEATAAMINDADFEGIRFRGHLSGGKLVVEGFSPIRPRSTTVRSASTLSRRMAR